MTSPLLRHIETDTQTLDRARLPGAADGCVIVDARPGTRRQSWLGRDLLAGCGIDNELGIGRNTTADWQLMPVLLAARHIRSIVVDDAQLLPVEVLTDLLVLAAGAGADVWVITRPPVHDSFNTAFADWAAAPASFEQLYAALPVPAPTPPAAGTPVLEVPDALVEVDGLLVRPLLHTLLPPEQARRIDAVLAAAVHDAHTMLTAAADDSGPVRMWLYERLDAARSRARFLLDVRALQIAGWWNGLLVGVDVATLDGWLLANPGPGGAPAGMWQRLRGYRQPFRGAVCALAATRLGTGALLAVTIGDTAADGSHIVVDGERLEVPAAAAEFVATQRLYRRAEGAAETEALLTDFTGEVLTDKFVARIITQARTELGVVVSARRTERTTVADDAVLRRLGITLTRVAAPQPTGPLTGRQHPAPLLAPQPVPAPRPSPLLNTDLLRRRRLELRKSRRDLAQALGVAGAAIAGLENGTNHADQTLGTVAKLAETLAVDLPTLFTGAARTPARFSQQAVGQLPSEQPSQADADLATLGAALHAAANPVSAAALADALGWTLPRLTQALDSLAAVAPTVGLRIDTSGGMVALVRAAEPLTSAQLTGALRRVVSRGIETTAARLICAALSRAVCAAPGRAGSGGLLRGNADRVAAGLLVNADLLALEEHGDVELTPATRTALYLPPPTESTAAHNEEAGGADA